MLSAKIYGLQGGKMLPRQVQSDAATPPGQNEHSQGCDSLDRV